MAKLPRPAKEPARVEAAAASLVLAHPRAEELDELAATFAQAMRNRGAAGLTEAAARDLLRQVRTVLDDEREKLMVLARLFAPEGRLREARYRHGSPFCDACGRYKDFAKECPACGVIELTM